MPRLNEPAALDAERRFASICRQGNFEFMADSRLNRIIERSKVLAYGA
jgi:hypothetical protein